MTEKFTKKPHILIVDDTPQNIQVLGSTLRQNDYEVIVATSGIQALKIVEKITPDLILLDIMMPEMDGYETCQKLKSAQETKNIPVIFLTALTKSEDIVKGFEFGAIDYVTKPFNIAELLARVNTHLELKFSKEIILRKTAKQNELLHVLCHDLTNPMGAVQTLLLIANNKPEEWLFQKKNMMQQAVENGLQTIELVRKMSALEEHKLKIDIVSANLWEMIDTSFSILRQKFDKKKVELVLELDETLKVQVETVSFINSVLNNIFTNAIKFSLSGSKILVNAEKEEGFVTVVIRDFGVGMPEGLLNDLFEIGKSTNRKGTDGEPGTGFGMPLMKKFITLYGGVLEVSSKEKSNSPEDHGTWIKMKLKPGD